jgi:divalent metal cation (Fe/Co/Zn/Cd) transporter
MVRGRKVRLWRFLQLSKDPSLFATLLEDGAALIGLSIAALGVVGAGWLHLLWADGAASVGVGLLLVSVAVFVANETRSLIAGEAATPFIVAQACAALEGDPRIAKVLDLASLHLGPESILVAVTVKFQDDLNAVEVKRAADALIERVRLTDPRICSVLLQLE